MPFKSRDQQKWYYATNQDYLDDEPSSARKVKESTNFEELQSPSSQDQQDNTKDLQSSSGSSREGLGDDETPEMGFNLTSTEDLSVSGPPADSFMRKEDVKLKHTESVLVKRGENYKWVKVFTEAVATEDDYGGEPCGLCDIAYKDHKDRDHKFVEPQIGRKAGVAESNVMGNCDFCDGTGKVTVEHLGIKDCPRCEGNGNLESNEQIPMMPEMDPSQQIAQANEEPQEKTRGLYMEKPRPRPYEKKPLSPSAMDRKKEQDKGTEGFIKCPNMKAYCRWVDTHISDLKTNFAEGNESVGLMFSMPDKELIGEGKKKIKGRLAYAGASLNNRVYLPEELSKGHEADLPLLVNHSSTAGAEGEFDRLPEDVKNALENHEDYQVGEVHLTWHPDKLTLSYEGYIEDGFFAKEVDEMDMAVSLGIFYNSDSPKYCSTESNGECYTMIEGAEFREVSLVYHPGFPIATIEAVEAHVKTKAVEAQVGFKKQKSK